VVHFRGSDIIDKHTYYDYLKTVNAWETIDIKRMSRPDQLEKIRMWSKYADVLLVSTPNLMELVPKAKVSPQLIDINYWRTAKKPLSKQDGIFRIAHAPTMKKVKGTEVIINTVEALKAEGYPIELILIENYEHDKVKASYELCDVGIDQLLIGWHGKVAVELMAMGKPVICNINPAYLKHRPDLPIIQADRNDLKEVVLDLFNSPNKIEEIGQLSLQYVSMYHDVSKETERLLELYMQNSSESK
jgi:glycosyltransferase involved in cell wall biosynthesis